MADVLTAPEGQARAETIGIVRRSLKETCGLSSLPGVDDPADYRPVKPVRKAVQSHFDQDAVYGGAQLPPGQGLASGERSASTTIAAWPAA